MPQAALPDINTILITHRREMIVDLKSKRFSGVIGALFSMNAALPKKYQVEVSTQKYNEALSKNIIAVCLDCKQETEYSKIKVEDIYLSSFESLVLKSRYDKKWKCPKCQKYNSLTKTPLIKPEPKKPYFLGVIPDQPLLEPGLINEIEYPKRFEAWARNFLIELEYQMGKYRVEYKPNDHEDVEEYQDGGEQEKPEDGF